MLTTAVYEIAGKSHINHNHRTVPVTSELFAFFKDAKDQKVDFVIMEATSQALHQHKLRGIPVEIAVMTNLTQDHLDYHGTMHNYAAAKARLFNQYMNPNYCVLNRDDEWFSFYQKRSVGVVSTYGSKPGSDVRIMGMTPKTQSTDFVLQIDGKKYPAHIGLPGSFNVQNAAAAAAVGQWLGLSAATIVKGLASLVSIPGRMQSVEAGQDFGVIIDYAVTPDALEKVLTALRPVTKGKLMIVFGATGDRDRLKRPIMGEVVGRLADKIFLTDDETYSEDPATIRNDVYVGIKQAKATNKTEVIDDRKAAIKAAFAQAKKGDTVLLTGIGHQNSRNMGGIDQDWNEYAIAKTIIKQG